jgi:hypothetical protein
MNEERIVGLTKEIARSKAISKVRGPFLVACTACGKYYDPDKKEEHLANQCRPPKIHINAKTQSIRERQRYLAAKQLQKINDKRIARAARRARKMRARANAAKLRP